MEAGGHKYINVMPLDKYRKGSVRTIKRNLKQMEMYRKWISGKTFWISNQKQAALTPKSLSRFTNPSIAYDTDRQADRHTLWIRQIQTDECKAKRCNTASLEDLQADK